MRNEIDFHNKTANVKRVEKKLLQFFLRMMSDLRGLNRTIILFDLFAGSSLHRRHLLRVVFMWMLFNIRLAFSFITLFIYYVQLISNAFLFCSVLLTSY